MDMPKTLTVGALGFFQSFVSFIPPFLSLVISIMTVAYLWLKIKNEISKLKSNGRRKTNI